MPPHVHDLRHVLDEDRTGLHAGQAGGASPEDVVGDDLTDHHLLTLGPAISPFGQEGRPHLEKMRLEVEDEHLRVELLTARGRRAAVGAAPALGTVVEVKEAFPGELGDPPYSEALRV